MIEMWDDLFCARDPAVRAALDCGDGLRAFNLMHCDLDRAWLEIGRVLIDGGWVCVNVGDATRTIDGRFRLYPNHARVISACTSLGFDILPAVVWRKQTNAPNKFMGSGMLPAGAYVTLEHEYILLMRKGAKREFSAADKKRLRRQSAYFWEERNRWFSDIWDFKGTRQDLSISSSRERSAGFPFELPYRLINMSSIQGDTVLDPFVGTGVTTLAAMASGRDSVGVVSMTICFAMRLRKRAPRRLFSTSFSRKGQHPTQGSLKNTPGIRARSPIGTARTAFPS
jgi:DNA modification methylase